MRSTAPQVDALVDGDRTAQLQGAVAATLQDALPGNRRWEADALSQFARLMRDIRNHGVHPRQVTDGDIEVYFTEDKCGLLFLDRHRCRVRSGARPGRTARPAPSLAGYRTGPDRADPLVD